MGGNCRWCLRFSSICFASSVHWNLLCHLSNLKKGNARSPSHEINLFRAAIQPMSFWTSLIDRGVSMSVMAVIFSVTVHVLVMLDIYFVSVKYVLVSVKLVCVYMKLLKNLKCK
jgi:hypothetical protein